MRDPIRIEPSCPQALDVGLKILNALGASQGVSELEIAAALGMPTRDITPILAILLHRRMIYRDLLELYWLGLQVAFLGRQLSIRNAINQVSGEALDCLVKEAREDAAVVVLEGLEVQIVAYQHFDKLPHLDAAPRLTGRRGPLWIGGAAKLLLAYAPESVINQVITAHLADFIPKALRSREKVLALLNQIRQDGFHLHLAIGESDNKVFTLTAPIRDVKDTVVAAIGVRALRSRITPSYVEHLKVCVLRAAAHVSARLR